MYCIIELRLRKVTKGLLPIASRCKSEIVYGVNAEVMATVYKTLPITNIDKLATQKDILQIFGLAANEQVKLNSSIQMEVAAEGGNLR